MHHTTRLSLLSLATAAMAFSTTALAGPHGRHEGWDRDSRSDYAQVLSARPIYSRMRVSAPREECWDERVVYRDEPRDDYRRSRKGDRVVGTVIGGVIGGAIGHQFSEGSGKKIATAIGAVVGAEVGRNSVDEAYAGRSSYREEVRYEPRCRTRHETRYEEQVRAYDVTYRYHGEIYRTELPYDPGSRLRVQVEVSPLRY